DRSAALLFHVPFQQWKRWSNRDTTHSWVASDWAVHVDINGGIRRRRWCPVKELQNRFHLAVVVVLNLRERDFPTCRTRNAGNGKCPGVNGAAGRVLQSANNLTPLGHSSHSSPKITMVPLFVSSGDVVRASRGKHPADCVI